MLYTASRRSVVLKLTLFCALVVFTCTLYLIMAPDPLTTSVLVPLNTNRCIDDHTKSSQGNIHKLAVIIPFRDRFDELLEFIPHMQKFLERQGICYKMIVVNQVDSLR